MRKIATVLALTSALAAGASAQSSTKIDKPLSAELGLYIPTFSGGSKDVGFDVGVGYDVYKMSDITLSGVLRYQLFSVSNTDLSMYSYGVEANYRPKGAKYYGGVGILGATLSANGYNTTKGAYTLQAGYDITEKLSAFVRYQNTFDDRIKAYEGITVGVGYRF